MADEKPPEQHETPPESPPEKPTEPPPHVPEPEHVAESHDEKVPAWGEALMAKVDALADLFPDPVKDETPAKQPWHKKKPLG